MPKISSYPDGGVIQAGDQFVIARAGANKSILGNKWVNRTAFTPTVVGTTIAGAGTYTSQLGEYCRIANLIFFTIVLGWTAHTGTGNMTVAGLPFPAVNNAIPVPVTVAWNDVTLAAVGNKLIGFCNPAASNITLYEIAAGSLTSLPMDTVASLWLAGFYFMA